MYHTHTIPPLYVRQFCTLNNTRIAFKGPSRALQPPFKGPSSTRHALSKCKVLRSYPPCPPTVCGSVKTRLKSPPKIFKLGR